MTGDKPGITKQSAAEACNAANAPILAAIATQPEAHRRTKLVRTAGLLTALVLLIGIAFLSYRSTIEFETREGLIAHSYEVKSGIDELTATGTRVRLLWRQYLIGGDLPQYADYQAEIRKIPDSIENLTLRTRDNPEQQRRIHMVRTLFDTELANLSERAELKRDGKLRHSEAILAEISTGRPAAAQSRLILYQMDLEEDLLLAARTLQSHRSATRPPRS